MKIGLDVQSTLHQKTGIGAYTVNLLHALREIATEHEFIGLDWGRAPVMRTDRRLAWQQIILPHRTQRAGCSLLHVTGFDAPFWKPCPVVMTVHDLIGVLFPENLPPVGRFYWSKWLPFTIRFADAVIAVSESSRRDIQRLIGISPDRTYVVPLGVGPQFRVLRKAHVDDVRRKYGLPEALILFVSTLEPRKGADTLIKAFNTLSINHPHHLVLIGKKGWFWERIINFIDDCGAKDRVHVVDYVPEEDLPALYNAAQVFVLPSRYEGFGLPVLEAMACGVPVICSNTSSLPEVVGDAGLTLSPDQPMELASLLDQVLRNEDLRRELSAKGIDRATKFTWEETARQTARVYETVVSP